MSIPLVSITEKECNQIDNNIIDSLDQSFINLTAKAEIYEIQEDQVNASACLDMAERVADLKNLMRKHMNGEVAEAITYEI